MLNWKQNVVNSFDTAAPTYDAHCDIQRHAAQKLATFCLAENYQDILEIGCGTGVMSKHLLNLYSNANLHITDISSAMIARARENLRADHIEYSVLDGENPPKDRRYDLIISNMAFQWFEDWDAAFIKLKSILKPDGQILYSLPGPESFKEWNETLAALNLQSGILKFKNRDDCIHQEAQQIEYENAPHMLKSLKAIGAHKPRAGYNSLSITQLRNACKSFDEKYQGALTWHIIYGRLDSKSG